MRRVALVTYSDLPELSPDDQLLAAALRRRGIDPVAASWDAAVDWRGFDLVLLRSCWDYHLRPAEFAAWLEILESAGVTAQNPVALLRWNADKTYLRDLGRRGVRVPETVWLAAGEPASVQAILRQHGWPGAVVKPTVAASAFGARRIAAGEPDFVATGPLMVQQFLPAVTAHGEWSLVFLGGTYSHAVLKRPAAGDFRVQIELGGSAVAASPGARRIAQAAAIVAAIDPLPLYARVDVIDATEASAAPDLVLMELELIEPTLFLREGDAAGRFADLIAATVEAPD